MAVNIDEALLAHPPLTSCRAAPFLIGHRLYRSVARELGTPDLRQTYGEEQKVFFLEEVEFDLKAKG